VLRDIDVEAQKSAKHRATQTLGRTRDVNGSELRVSAQKQALELSVNDHHTLAVRDVNLSKSLAQITDHIERLIAGRDRSTRKDVPSGSAGNGSAQKEGVGILSQTLTSGTGERVHRTGSLRPVDVVNVEVERLL